MVQFGVSRFLIFLFLISCKNKGIRNQVQSEKSISENKSIDTFNYISPFVLKLNNTVKTDKIVLLDMSDNTRSNNELLYTIRNNNYNNIEFCINDTIFSTSKFLEITIKVNGDNLILRFEDLKFKLEPFYLDGQKYQLLLESYYFNGKLQKCTPIMNNLVFEGSVR